MRRDGLAHADAGSRGLRRAEGCIWRQAGQTPWLPGGSTPRPRPEEEEKLGRTAREGDGLLLLEEVTEHLRGYGAGI